MSTGSSSAITEGNIDGDDNPETNLWRRSNSEGEAGGRSGGCRGRSYDSSCDLRPGRRATRGDDMKTGPREVRRQIYRKRVRHCGSVGGSLKEDRAFGRGACLTCISDTRRRRGVNFMSLRTTEPKLSDQSFVYAQSPPQALVYNTLSVC